VLFDEITTKTRRGTGDIEVVINKIALVYQHAVGAEKLEQILWVQPTVSKPPPTKDVPPIQVVAIKCSRAGGIRHETCDLVLKLQGQPLVRVDSQDPLGIAWPVFYGPSPLPRVSLKRMLNHRGTRFA